MLRLAGFPDTGAQRFWRFYHGQRQVDGFMAAGGDCHHLLELRLVLSW